MANIISDETIEYVGILAKLELSAEEKEAAKSDMGRMLDYIDKILLPGLVLISCRAGRTVSGTEDSRIIGQLGGYRWIF